MRCERFRPHGPAVRGVALFGIWALFSAAALAQNPVPFVNQPLVPDAVAPGGPDFTLTVNGTGFVSGAVVDWNGSPLATQFVSGSQLTATVPAAYTANPTTALVTVVNPAPSGGRSNVAFFYVRTSGGDSVGFGSSSSLVVGSNPSSPAIGDFNGDGKLDLAVPNECGSDPSCNSPGSISILLGDGTGNFSLASTPTTGYGPGVAVGDFNGDGNLDLAVVNGCGNGPFNPCNPQGTISILLGDGTGNFTLASSLNLGVYPGSPVVGDFNRDGNLDIAVLNACGNDPSCSNASISVLLGDGTGKFTLAASPLLFRITYSLAVGDFNGDGNLDLAAGTWENNGSVSTLLGDGTGNFSTGPSSATGEFPVSMVVGDFNGDGKLDVATLSSDYATVSVLLGDGTGNFTTASSVGTGSVSPTSLTVGDFNGDGKLDLAVTNICGDDPSCGGGTVSILLGDGTGKFTLVSSPATATGRYPAPVAAGDFNGDGELDLAATDTVNGVSVVSILLQVLIPGVEISPASLSFGPQVLGTTSAPQTLTLTNTGNASLTITSIAASGDFAETNTCGSALAAGASCTVTVTFAPTQTEARTGAITFTDNSADSPQTVSLSGTGVVAGFNVTLSSTSLTFPFQNVNTSSAAQTVTFTNTGTTALNITSIAASGDFAQTNTCGNSLASAASCAINVSFTPTQTGTRTGTITIADNAPGSPQVVSLSGTGLPPAGVTLLPPSLDLQNCTGGGLTQSLTLTNNYSDAVQISSIAFVPGYCYSQSCRDFSQTNNCGTSVGSGQSCTITVSYSSYAQTYEENADLDVTWSDSASPPDQGVATASLSGVVWFCFTTITPNPTSLTFPSQVVGTTSSPQTVLLTGSWPPPATISAAATGDFSASITQPAGCCRDQWISDVTVTFTPTVTGTRTGSVTVSAAGYTAPVIPLTGTGATFSAQNPVPFISQPLVPDAVAPGGTDFTLTVNGAGFVSGSVVRWNGSALTTQFVTGTQLKATVPAADILTAGTAAITAASPEPGGGTSNRLPLLVNVPDSTVLFGPASTLSVGAGPNSVAVGDFNGDGLLDLAISNWLDGTVSVFLGDGTGNFTLASSPVTGAGPLAVTVGDFNGDGRLDLAVCDSSTSTVLVLLGDSTGHFTLASSPAVGTNPWSAAVGDFNEDGNLDLAVANEGSGTVSILLGDGTGNFIAGASPATGAAPTSVAAGDFNGDGKLDLAVANPSDGTVSILLGDGTGNFTLASSPATGKVPESVAAGDFSGDGKLDLAVANNGDSTVSILLGDGTGHFTPASSPAMSQGVFSLAVGDFNNDGNLDLAVTNTSNTVSILLGDGKGTFTLATSLPTGTEPLAVALGDFNGDENWTW